MAYKLVDVTQLQKAIEKKQETINKHSKALKTAPKGILVGWTEKSGTYPEQSRKPENDTAFKEVILDFRGVKDRKGEKEFRDSYKTKVMDVARIHEYGLGNQSEKAMLRTTKMLYMKKFRKHTASLIKEYTDAGKIPDYYAIAEDLGDYVREHLKSYILRIDLVDTKRLANSIIVDYRRRR